MNLIDTHCHLDMLADDLDAILERMRAAGVERAVTIGTDAASNECAVRCAETRAEVWATVGLHPHDARARTDALMGRLEELAAHPRVVGVGEAGLDYHYDHSPRDAQRAVFAEQAALARRAGKPLVVHTREAWEDTFAILEADPPERIVFHCWSGGPGEAARAVALGAQLSFAGTVTFAKADDLRAAARATPLERIVVETDAPFLAPVPHRGKRNEPALVAVTVARIAEVKGLAMEEVARATTENARQLFGWG